MQLYSATVRLNGSLFNEVVRHDLTAAEIIVLQKLHGGDAIRNVVSNATIDIKDHAGKSIGKRDGHADRTDEAERERLKDFYGPGVSRIENVKTLDAIFGPPGVALPSYVPGVENLPAAKGGKRAPKVEPTEPVEPIKEEEFA